MRKVKANASVNIMGTNATNSAKFAAWMPEESIAAKIQYVATNDIND